MSRGRSPCPWWYCSVTAKRRGLLTFEMEEALVTQPHFEMEMCFLQELDFSGGKQVVETTVEKEGRWSDY